MIAQACLNNVILVTECCAAGIAGEYVKAKTYGDKIAESLLRKLKYIDSLISIAEDYKGSISPEWEFDCADCWIFDENLIEVTDSVAKLIGPAHDQTNPTIKIDCALEGCEIISLEEEVTKVGNDDIRYTVEVNGTEMWYDGDAWVSSAGYAETNTIAEIVNNKDSLTLTTRIRIVAYLHSDDGSTTPELDALNITVGFCDRNCLTEEQMSAICEKMRDICPECNC